MRQRNIPEVRRCCNGSGIMRGRASLIIFCKKGVKKMSDKKVVKEGQNEGHGPGKQVQPGANVVPRSWWIGKGKKSSPNN